MFKYTAKQLEAFALMSGPASDILLYGGSRSTKTYTICDAICTRAMKAPRSRHAILRFRFNSCKTSIAMDTWPKMLSLSYPGLQAPIDKTDWYAKFPNGSEVWFGGLDDKERAEKILGHEYATIALIEASQIPWNSRNLAKTRLAQRCVVKVKDQPDYFLPLKMYYDCNPPKRTHWTHKVFRKHTDPETKRELMGQFYASLQMNPADNAENLPAEYIESLKTMSARMRRRFWEGEWSDDRDNTLFADEDIDKWRVIDGKLPDYSRIVIAVDPSGSGDVDNADNDAIGIVVAALGTDGNGYVLEDLTCKAGPATWGRIATDAFDRHSADVIVGEVNYGGEMVRHVIQTARPRTPYRAVTATRGKVVRAEPVSALVESGKVRLVGYFPELEEELSGFTTAGYMGEGSPNRADAFVWAMTALFPGIVAGAKAEPVPTKVQYMDLYTDGRPSGSDEWMRS